MADTIVLEVQERKKVGTNAAKQVRKQGLVPGVIYGHEEATIPLSVPGDTLYKSVRQGVRVYDVKLGNVTQKVLLRDVHWDVLGQDILHVDFYRVAADETITLEVRVEIRGTAPGIVTGGVLVQPMHNLTVECLLIAIPESIRVNVGELQLNQSIKVRDLKLPEGVVVKNDPDAIIVQVSPKIEEVEVVAAPVAAAEGAEPEVIKKAKAEAEPEAEASAAKK